MKLASFKRMGEKIRHSLRKENTKTVVVLEVIPQPEVDDTVEITINEPSVVMSADRCAEQVRYSLLKDNRLVGKSLSSYHPEIWVIHVDSLVNAFLFFLRICDQRLLTYRQTGEYLHCTAVFPDEGGSLYSANKATCRNKENTVAILKINYMDLKPRTGETRLELNIKK